MTVPNKSTDIEDIKLTLGKQSQILEYVVKHTETTTQSLDLLRTAVTTMQAQMSFTWKLIGVVGSLAIAVSGGVVGAFITHFIGH